MREVGPQGARNPHMPASFRLGPRLPVASFIGITWNYNYMVVHPFSGQRLGQAGHVIKKLSVNVFSRRRAQDGND